MNKTKVYVSDISLLRDSSWFGKIYQTVSAARQRKIDAIRFEKDKKLCLAADMLLKKALSYEDVNSYEVKYGKFGKPYIENANIFFNLSHSKEMIMCAISSKEVGCDVEKIKDIDFKIAKRFFSSAEYDEIRAVQSDKERRDIFFRLWTLKESFMKATGLGMELPLDSFSIDLGRDEINICQNVNQERYYFKEYDLNNEYKYAVCSLIDNFDKVKFISLD